MSKGRAFHGLSNTGGCVVRKIVRRVMAAFVRAARSLRFAVLAGLSACTLLDEPYEPTLVPGPSGAGALGAADVTATPLSENTTPRGCVTEDADGSRSTFADSSCASDIDRLDPDLFDQSEADDGTASAPSLSLAPCRGEFGAFGAPERITGLDFDDDIYGPSLSSDGRTLYFSAYVDGEQQIYSATRSTRSSQFSNVTELPAINSPSMDGTPFITEGSEQLYFFSERQGGVGERDIWVSRRQGEAFAEPDLVRNINSEQSDLLPWLSADELTLVFVSRRSGGRGLADVWRSSRASLDEAFDDPVNVFELSSDENDGRMVLSADGLTAFFSSVRNGGRGGSDLWTASREDTNEPFSPTQNLTPLNTGANELDVLLSSDETELFFASSRREGVSELWRAARSCS